MAILKLESVILSGLARKNVKNEIILIFTLNNFVRITKFIRKLKKNHLSNCVKVINKINVTLICLTIPHTTTE